MDGIYKKVHLYYFLHSDNARSGSDECQKVIPVAGPLSPFTYGVRELYYT